MRGVGDFLLSLFFRTPELRDDFFHPTSSPMNILFQHQALWPNRVCVELEEVKAQTAKEVDLEQDGV